uniref:Uncharacterized protein n=1 Tax=Anguilla anguilla TaxID=7936 RepID=A0A0E9PTM8_ANGAN
MTQSVVALSESRYQTTGLPAAMPRSRSRPGFEP